MLRTIEASLPPTQAALLEGILIGQRAGLPPDLAADFVHTGTVHILASAGLHVGIIAASLWLLFNSLTLHRKASAATLIGLLWVYVFLSGERPSVTRAVLMATIYFGALLFEREPDLPTTLAASAFAMLAVSPSSLFESGFLLSFATVITLAMIMPVWDAWLRPRIDALPLARPWRRLLLRAAELVGVTVFSQIGALPVVASAYNEMSLSGFAANVLVVPLLFLIIPLGITGVTLGIVWRPLSAVFFAGASPLLGWTVDIVRAFGESSTGFTATPPPDPVAVACYYAAVAGLSWYFAKRLPKPSPTSPITAP